MLPLPLEILAADPPPPWNFQQPSVGGGGSMYIFYNYTLQNNFFFPGKSQINILRLLEIKYLINVQEWEKVPSEEDSPSGQVAFDSHWLNGKGIRQVHCQLNHKSAKSVQGKKN